MEFWEKAEAVVAFKTGVAVFKNINGQVVYLKRLSTRHLATDLSTDLCSNKTTSRAANELLDQALSLTQEDTKG